MDKAAIIDKVNKLLALAGNNPNEHEAANAAAQAQRLMEKYQIAQFQVGGDQDDSTGMGVIDGVIIRQGRMDIWMQSLFVDLCHLYECDGYRARHGGGLRAIGLESDVEMVKTMFGYLVKVIRHLHKVEWDVAKARGEYSGGRRMANAFRRGFCQGAADRIVQRLQGEKAEAAAAECDVRALVVVKKDKIDKFKEDNDYKFRKQSRRSAGHAAGAYQKGQAAGNNVGLTAPAGAVA